MDKNILTIGVDILPELAQTIVNKFHKTYHIFQICRKDSVVLENVEK